MRWSAGGDDPPAVRVKTGRRSRGPNVSGTLSPSRHASRPAWRAGRTGPGDRPGPARGAHCRTRSAPVAVQARAARAHACRGALPSLAISRHHHSEVVPSNTPKRSRRPSGDHRIHWCPLRPKDLPGESRRARHEHRPGSFVCSRLSAGEGEPLSVGTTRPRERAGPCCVLRPPAPARSREGYPLLVLVSPPSQR